MSSQDSALVTAPAIGMVLQPRGFLRQHLKVGASFLRPSPHFRLRCGIENSVRPGLLKRSLKMCSLYPRKGV